MALITLSNVNMSYEGRTVIKDLNLTLESGDYLCIVGENGSGKTTLLKGLLGLKKIDSGTIVFGDGLKQENIGYLPQQSEFQRDFPASVREVVRSGRVSSNPFYSSADKKIAREAMEKLEIADIEKKCYHELSGGQQQRVLLARAICAGEKLLILDEPVNGLDTNSTEEMYEIIHKLNKNGMTIIMISHDIDRVVKSAGTILHIDNHQLIFYGNVSDYCETILKQEKKL